eukprot:10599658-Alexandrium_andersonii.AAC.1
MSASLVGSEMCIRDSPKGPSSQRHRRLVCGKPSRVKASRRLAPKAQRPVSYTHLTLPTICSV